MTPNEKAKELFNNFYLILLSSDSDHSEEVLVSTLAKKCAIICVNEVLEQFKPFPHTEEGEKYFIEVKKEIEKL